jgi:tetratricopeptide (TPR) repeat protein
MEKKYPFKFLDAYRREDIDFFFGRKAEVEALYQMIFQGKMLLLYGTSGTGKTSLIQCGLANKFQTYDWLALNIRRGSNLIASLDKILCQESDDVFEYQETKPPKIQNLTEKIEAVYRASFKPIYLIFDQFEELYVLGSKAEQKQFIACVKEILRIDQPVKIIISIREEYLGFLYEFERAVPELLRKKLRVEPMNIDVVKTVIRSMGSMPEGNVRLQAGEEDAIAEEIFEKIRGKNSLTIELPYLQVFLDKLYLQTTGDEHRQADALFTLEALKQMGDIGDVLRDFLDEQALKIAQELGQKPETIWQILSPFVTLEGTKDPLSEPELRSRRSEIKPALLDDTLQALVKSRILRFSEHDQRYEIAHDALAKQVHAKRSDEDIALLEVQRLIKSTMGMKAEAREFFTAKQLGFIEPYLTKVPLTKEEKEHVANSQRDVLKKRNMRRRWRIAAGVTLVIIVFSLAVLLNSAATARDKAQQALKTIEYNEIKRKANDLKYFGDSYEALGKKTDAAEYFQAAFDSLDTNLQEHPGLKQDTLYNILRKKLNH